MNMFIDSAQIFPWFSPSPPHKCVPQMAPKRVTALAVALRQRRDAPHALPDAVAGAAAGRPLTPERHVTIRILHRTMRWFLCFETPENHWEKTQKNWAKSEKWVSTHELNDEFPNIVQPSCCLAGE